MRIVMSVAGRADKECGGDKETGETRSAEIWSEINTDYRSGLRSTQITDLV